MTERKTALEVAKALRKAAAAIENAKAHRWGEIAAAQESLAEALLETAKARPQTAATRLEAGERVLDARDAIAFFVEALIPLDPAAAIEAAAAIEERLGIAPQWQAMELGSGELPTELKTIAATLQESTKTLREVGALDDATKVTIAAEKAIEAAAAIENADRALERNAISMAAEDDNEKREIATGVIGLVLVVVSLVFLVLVFQE